MVRRGSYTSLYEYSKCTTYICKRGIQCTCVCVCVCVCVQSKKVVNNVEIIHHMYVLYDMIDHANLEHGRCMQVERCCYCAIQILPTHKVWFSMIA